MVIESLQEQFKSLQPLSGLVLRSSARGLQSPAATEFTSARDIQFSAKRIAEAEAAKVEDCSEPLQQADVAGKEKQLSSREMPLSERSLSDAFRTPDRGLRFGRRMASRVSLGPMDVPPATDASGEEEEGRAEDESLSPLIVPGEDSTGNFAQRMLLVCRRVAMQAREEGPNLIQTDSSVSPTKSPTKRNGTSAKTSSTKRRLCPTPHRRRAWIPPEDDRIVQTPTQKSDACCTPTSVHMPGPQTPGMVLDRILSEQGLPLAERVGEGSPEGL